jgi:DNA replication protein DnaC
MTTVGINHPDAGYAWSMADSNRLSIRAQEVMDRMQAAAGFDAERARRIAERAAALPDNWSEIENEKILAEQRAQRASIMLKRMDPLYRNAVPRHAVSQSWLERYRASRAPGEGAPMPPGNLVIAGPTGAGKTWEANAIARQLLADDFVPVLVTSVAAMIETMKPNGDGAMDEGQFKVAPVLLADDLGAERLTEFAEERLRAVMDYRMGHRLPTIFTSNLAPREIRERYEARLFRRITEGSELLVIKRNEHRPATPQEYLL